MNFKAGTNYKAGTNFKAGINFKAGTNHQFLLKLLIDGAASITLYQRRCNEKIYMVPNFHQEYVSNDHC